MIALFVWPNGGGGETLSLLKDVTKLRNTSIYPFQVNNGLLICQFSTDYVQNSHVIFVLIGVYIANFIFCLC